MAEAEAVETANRFTAALSIERARRRARLDAEQARLDQAFEDFCAVLDALLWARAADEAER